jgi:hypothetical protein
MRIADEDNPDDANSEKIGGSDGTALGVSFDIAEGFLLAVAVDQSDGVGAGDDVDRAGFAVKYSRNNWWTSVSWGETDVDGDAIAQTQFHVGAGFGDGVSGFLGFGILDVDGDSDEPVATTANLTKKFGTSGFRIYYEGVIMSDGDELYGYEQDSHFFGARMDF